MNQQMNQLIITMFWFRADDAASPVSDTVFITLYLLELWTLTFIIVIILNNGRNVAAISFPSEGTRTKKRLPQYSEK